MARFGWNWRMAFVLTVALCLAASPTLFRPAHADGSYTTTGDVNLPPGPPASGDPDLPDGPSKSVRNQGQRQGVAVHTFRSKGDERDLRGVWIWRLRVALQSLRAITIRF